MTKEKRQKKNNSLLKTFNQDIITFLIECDLPYTIERINNLEIYGFMINEDLEKYLNSNFSKEDFFFEKRLRF